MTENDYRFIGHAVTRCTSKRITVTFSRKSQVEALDPGKVPFKCAGYFDEDKKLRELAVGCAKAQRDWFPIFVHEYCHFLQWVEKNPLYFAVIDDKEMGDALWNFINRKELKTPKSLVVESARAWQALELDCEKKAVELIEEFDLSIDVADYIQSANIYILFYSILPKTGDWYTTPPYEIDKIVSTMPEHFLDDYIRMPDGFEELIMANCYG